MIAQPSTPFVPHPYRSPPVIGAIGRLSSEKGFADWLWALSLLEQQSIPFQAVLAGDGDERGSLEALAATLGLTDRLRFIGWVEDKAAFYRSIDVLCVPSHQESFGLVVLEAMAYGVPVLATRTSGPGTIINDARNGRLVAIGDYTALAETLRSMLAQPEETQAYAMQAHQTVQEYSKEKVMQALSKVLEDVISS